MLLHVVVGLVGIFLEAFRLFLHAFLDLEYSGRLGLIVLAGSAEAAEVVVAHAAARVLPGRSRSVRRAVLHAVEAVVVKYSRAAHRVRAHGATHRTTAVRAADHREFGLHWCVHVLAAGVG